jgi:hypothetical protein
MDAEVFATKHCTARSRLRYEVACCNETERAITGVRGVVQLRARATS